MRLVVRSILAVLAGYLTIAIIVMGITLVSVPLFTDVSNPLSNRQDASRSLGSSWYLFEFLYSLPAGFFGGYVAALIARRAESQHALALAGLMLAMGVMSVVQSQGFKPAWHSIALTLLGALACVGGGLVRARQVRKKAERLPEG